MSTLLRGEDCQTLRRLCGREHSLRFAGGDGERVGATEALAAAESCEAGLVIIDDGLWAPEFEGLPASDERTDTDALVDSLAALNDLGLGVDPDAPLEVKIATLVALAAGRDQPDSSDLTFGRAMCSRDPARF